MIFARFTSSTLPVIEIHFVLCVMYMYNAFQYNFIKVYRKFEMKIFFRNFGKYNWVNYCYTCKCIFFPCRSLEKGKETLSQ